ncbi:hypothetical protein K490DRAFT_1937, partial [Saccharata proteae CBS 121410]
ISSQSNPDTILPLLYISHTLSAWNIRTFEFASVLFIATLFPSTLLPASLYALIRATAAFALGGYVGRRVDGAGRLSGVRASIVAMRGSVAGSCVGLAGIGWVLRSGGDGGWGKVLVGCVFGACVGLACVEKLGSVANTVAVERDWVVVIAEDSATSREELNSTMRRIDLLAKMLAPVFVSLVDAYSSNMALWVVFGQNMLSVLIEYYTIARVYSAVPSLQIQKVSYTNSSPSSPISPNHTSTTPSQTTPSSTPLTHLHNLLSPWTLYISSPVFLASFSLSLLYLTVLSTGIQLQTYLLTLSFTALHVSLLRIIAVIVELLATWAAPRLMRRIGPVRAGLWFLNQQLVCVVVAVGLYFAVGEGSTAATLRAKGLSLMAGVAVSRLGLWGFDLCVQFLVQEDVPSPHRATFSAAELALQNAFELLSFASTAVFARPDQFMYPVLISGGAVAVAACCFAAFVRKRRGHLLHASKC